MRLPGRTAGESDHRQDGGHRLRGWSFFVKWTFDHDGGPSPGGAHRRTATVRARRPPVARRPGSGLPWILEAEPVEGQALIDQGGPFPFPGKDGSTFGNLEGSASGPPTRLLPRVHRCHPRLDDRGARRIIIGTAGEFYWTEDHYSILRTHHETDVRGHDERRLAAPPMAAAPRPPGVYRWHARVRRPTRSARGRARRLAVRVRRRLAPPDARRVPGRVGETLDFPDHYGQNLDALTDCLRDLPGSTRPAVGRLVHAGPPGRG